MARNPEIYKAGVCWYGKRDKVFPKVITPCGVPAPLYRIRKQQPIGAVANFDMEALMYLCNKCKEKMIRQGFSVIKIEG